MELIYVIEIRHDDTVKADRSIYVVKVCTVSNWSNTGIVFEFHVGYGHVCTYMFVLPCIGTGLAMGQSPVQKAVAEGVWGE
jgi:hypothetical protein